MVHCQRPTSVLLIWVRRRLVAVPRAEAQRVDPQRPGQRWPYRYRLESGVGLCLWPLRVHVYDEWTRPITKSDDHRLDVLARGNHLTMDHPGRNHHEVALDCGCGLNRIVAVLHGE